MQKRQRSYSSCEELPWPQMRTSSCLPGACSTASEPGQQGEMHGTPQPRRILAAGTEMHLCQPQKACSVVTHKSECTTRIQFRYLQLLSCPSAFLATEVLQALFICLSVHLLFMCSLSALLRACMQV